MKTTLKFKLSDYRGHLTDFMAEVPFSDINLTIIYTVLSGDEVVSIYHCGELIGKYDGGPKEPGCTRIQSCLDELKVITKEELENLHTSEDENE